MDIKDYAQMMSYLTRPRDVVPDPSTMNQEPRIGYAGAGVVLDIGTAGIKKAIPFVKQKLNEIIQRQIDCAIEWCNKYNQDVNYRSSFIRNRT